MKKPREYQVYSGTDKSSSKPLHGALLAEATALNLLITAALTRSSLQELSKLLPGEAQQCNLGILVTEEHMRFALSETGLSPILSLLDLAKTFTFSFKGSLTISSDEYGVAVKLDDTELDVEAHEARVQTDD